MPAKYTLRMQFKPQRYSRAFIADLLKTLKTAKADELMFFAFAEEQNDGHDPLDRIQEWIDSIRPLKAALEKAGMEVSLNPWHTLLHCDRGRRLKPGQKWQTMVDWQGRAATAVVCPLDPGWRAYYRQVLGLFAREHFRIIWVDDDIRYHNHGPLDWGGCWCPLHLAQFNRRAKANATREELVDCALRKGKPHPWRAIWFDMWDETQTELIAEWRDIIEPHGTRLGLMSSNLETHAAEGRQWKRRWWPAIARRPAPAHRPHFWWYADALPDIMCYSIAQMQQNRMVQPDLIESDPEIENGFYGYWNKSFRQTFAQLTMAQAFGSDRLAVSLYDFMGNLPGDEPRRETFLGQVKPALNWLAERFPKTLQPIGIGSPWHEDMGRMINTRGTRDWRALQLNTRGWDFWLMPFGFSLQKQASPRVNALSGFMPDGFSDDQLRDFLRRGLLLDGVAAELMIQRGFGDLIGLAKPRWITQDKVLYSIEECTDKNFALRAGAQIGMNALPYANRLLQAELLSGARAVSRLLNPRQEPVGHGMIVFENSLGGRVVVAPWDATVAPAHFTQRHAQFVRLLAWLGQGKSAGRVAGGAWLMPQFFVSGSQWRAIVWNGCPDAVREMDVEAPAGKGKITTAMHLDAEGGRYPATVQGRRLLFRRPVMQWECVVING